METPQGTEEADRERAAVPGARNRGGGVVRARRPLRLVMVRWRDAWFDFERDASGWRDEYVVQTVGFVVREEPGVISLAQELLPGRDGFRAITHIPRGGHREHHDPVRGRRARSAGDRSSAPRRALKLVRG